MSVQTVTGYVRRGCFLGGGTFGRVFEMQVRVGCEESCFALKTAKPVEEEDWMHEYNI